MSNGALDQFTGLYPVSKTLHFELKPVGNTLEQIKKGELISQDEERAKDYKTMKKLLDLWHKHFIVESLQKYGWYLLQNLIPNRYLVFGNYIRHSLFADSNKE